MKRIQTFLVGCALVLVAGAGVFWLWTQPAPPVASTPATVGATAEITRGPLIDTRTLTGTLGYGALSALRPALAEGSAVVTWLAPVGTTVRRGEPLYRLNDAPAILFEGTVPLHRTLRFEGNGAAPIWVEHQEAKAAVEAAILSLELARTRLADAEARIADAGARLADASAASPTTAQFIRLSGAVSAAETKLDRVRGLAATELAPVADVAAAEAELASARAALDEATRALQRELAAARLDAAAARLARTEAEARLDELRDALMGFEARAADNSDIVQLAENLAALDYEGPLAEQVRQWQADAGLPVTGVVGPGQVVVAEGTVHVAAHEASLGETLLATSSERGAILKYSTVERQVVVDLAVGQQALAAVGRPVAITLPDGAGIEGIVSEIGSVVTDGAIEITIGIPDQLALGALEVASVDVEFVSDSRNDVLSVPVAALLAQVEGGFAVEVVAGGSRTLVPVETGLFAGGRVEVRGEGLVEGARVGVPG